MSEMIRLLTIIGARPQIIKAAAISRAIKNRYAGAIEEILLHTGQHYDEKMSQVFFEELEIPAPAINLSVGSKSHGQQLAEMIKGIENALVETRPHALLVYGDTNSTLAGALAASKLHVPIVHIEAGLRSFSKSMPEEINRVLTDHVSTLLFSPTKKGIENLVAEGFRESNSPPSTIDNPGMYHCGDIMLDNSLYFSERAERKTDILQRHGLKAQDFVLATIHRDNNTDNPERLNAIFSALNKISLEKKIRVFLPLHPRTSKLLEKNLDPSLQRSMQENERFLIAEPASYLEMIALEKNCKMVITDSGGLQKEAYYFGKPCIILRPVTEWVELVEAGAAIITDADQGRIVRAYNSFEHSFPSHLPSFYGDGKAAEFICGEIFSIFSPGK